MTQQLKLIDPGQTCYDQLAEYGELRFTVLGLAETAGSKRAFRNPKSGRMIVTDANPRSKSWKQEVATAAVAVFGERELLDCALEVEFVFYRPRPKGHFGTKGLRALAPAWPTTKPDVLKLARAIEDSLTGVVYRDDSQIVDEVLRKRYGEPARVKVVVRQLD